MHQLFTYIHLHLARLRRGWGSPIYSFFSPDVKIGYENGRKYHFFKCNARVCKNPRGGQRRYLDTSDKTSTGNLKTHAVKCFSQAAIDAAMKGTDNNEQPDGSIYSVFGRQGSQPVSVTHKAHSDVQIRYVVHDFFVSFC